MAASMWRMNGVWRRMAELLVLSTLLLSNKVMCQEENATIAAAASAASANLSAVPDAVTTGATAVPTASSTANQTQAVVTSKSSPTRNNGDKQVHAVAPNENKNDVPKKVAPSSSGSSVFVGILVTGLLAALAIIVAYFKCQCRSDTQGVKLPEEAYPVDQENQGNTLVSEAPLNPPPETQEKPSINGESTEPAKTEPPAPPTNGHSTTKTADTEL